MFAYCRLSLLFPATPARLFFFSTVHIALQSDMALYRVVGEFLFGLKVVKKNNVRFNIDYFRMEKLIKVRDWTLMIL